jgi:hypothetical protein
MTRKRPETPQDKGFKAKSQDLKADEAVADLEPVVASGAGESGLDPLTNVDCLRPELAAAKPVGRLDRARLSASARGFVSCWRPCSDCRATSARASA